ncbi:MAG: 2-dehydropantoate 2-reductase [Rhizobiaceae bacterium]|nr:2-dehydropantoate 2-reductase [Rhizobiaceae bacterium]
MRVAIIGAGAMGSVYAGLFAAAGNDVLAVTRNRSHVDAINGAGLRVEGASGDRTVRLTASTSAQGEKADLVILAVKASQVAQAATEAAPLIGPRTTVLTIQNGLGSADAAAAVVGAEKLAVGIAGGFGASLPAPGHVYHTGMQVVQIGAYFTLDKARLDAVVDAWKAAGFNAMAAQNIAAMQWEKLICNVAFSPICALTGMTCGQVMDNPATWRLGIAASQEAWRIAKALNVGIKVEDPVAHVQSFGERVRGAKPSMRMDHEAGRASEIDAINGAVPRFAAQVGLEAPVNEMLTTLVKAREQVFLNAS